VPQDNARGYIEVSKKAVIIWLVLTTFGLCKIIEQGKPTKFLRRQVCKLGRLPCYFIKCTLCKGFWIGLGLSFLLPLDLWERVLAPFAAAGGAYFLSNLIWEDEEDEEDEIRRGN